MYVEHSAEVGASVPLNQKADNIERESVETFWNIAATNTLSIIWQAISTPS